MQSDSLIFIRCDSRTNKWFREHVFDETTLVKCEDCGLYYKPSIGHKCKKRRNENA